MEGGREGVVYQRPFDLGSQISVGRGGGGGGGSRERSNAYLSAITVYLTHAGERGGGLLPSPPSEGPIPRYETEGRSAEDKTGEKNRPN